MAKMISPADQVRSDKEFKELFAYVKTLWESGKVWQDLERAATFQRIFLDRDGAYADETMAKKLGNEFREAREDDKKRQDFEDRSIDLDVIKDALK
jgi:hypothetical protein